MEPRPGISVRASAPALGVSPTTIQRERTKLPDYAPTPDGTIVVGQVMGLDGKVRPSRRYNTASRDQTILDLREKGGTIRQIAETVRCSVGTVHRVLKAS